MDTRLTHWTGSVSSGAWCAICKRVLGTFEEIAKDLMAPNGEYQSGKDQRYELTETTALAPVPVAMPSQTQSQEKAKIEPLGIEHDHLD